MVKGSCYGEDHIDYYGILKEILELEYFDAKKVILFLCDWYDPKEGVTHDFKHDIKDEDKSSQCFAKLDACCKLSEDFSSQCPRYFWDNNYIFPTFVSTWRVFCEDISRTLR